MSFPGFGSNRCPICARISTYTNTNYTNAPCKSCANKRRETLECLKGPLKQKCSHENTSGYCTGTFPGFGSNRCRHCQGSSNYSNTNYTAVICKYCEAEIDEAIQENNKRTKRELPLVEPIPAPASRVPNRRNECVICLDKPYSVVLRPCSHLCVCVSCSSSVTHCPICRRVVETKETIILC